MAPKGNKKKATHAPAAPAAPAPATKAVVAEKLPEKLPELRTSFGAINTNNVNMLRKLNSVVFPVVYNDKFYTDILATPEDFTMYAYFQGFVVGAICCRIEIGEGGKKKLYIMTLGVLSAYRKRGVAKQLLEKVLAAVTEHPELGEIYLHVQISNESALAFYEKFDFVRGEKLDNYYKRIEPPHCFILRRAL